MITATGILALMGASATDEGWVLVACLLISLACGYALAVLP